MAVIVSEALPIVVQSKWETIAIKHDWVFSTRHADSSNYHPIMFGHSLIYKEMKIHSVFVVITKKIHLIISIHDYKAK